MDEAFARVVGIEDDGVWVNISPKAACGQCDSNAQCGTGLLGVAPAQRRVRLHGVTGCAVGDTVRIVAPDASVRLAALWAYGLPLLGVLGGALVGAALMPPASSPDDVAWLPVACGIAGLVAGFLGLRLLRPAGLAWQVERLPGGEGAGVPNNGQPIRFHPRHGD